MNTTIMNVSINLTDLDRSLFSTDKNGKKYLNIAIFERKQVGQFGDTHNMVYSKREDGGPTKYVSGSVKAVQVAQRVEAQPVTPIVEDYSLPF